MPIKLPKPTEQRLIASLRRYCAENLQEIGELQATLLLDFCLREVGPAVYNQAVSDAQAWVLDKVTDVSASCFEPEGSYWLEKKGRSPR